MPRFDDFQVKHWINEAMALATRTVTALERRVDQNVDIPLFSGEYAGPDENGLKTEDEVLQDNLSIIGKMLDPRSFAVEMGGEDGSVKMRATLSDEGRKQMGLKPKAEPTPSCDAPASVPPIWQVDHSYRKGDEVLIGDHAYRALNDVISRTGFFRYDAASGVICHPDWEFTRKVPRPTTTPSCDAPSCDCAEGEDCKANGAASDEWMTERQKVAFNAVAGPTFCGDAAADGPTVCDWMLTRDHVDGMGDTLKLSDGREVTQYALPESVSYEEMKEALHVAIRGLRDHKVGKSTFADKLRAPISLKDDDLTAKISGDGASLILNKPGQGRCFLVQELWDLPDVSDPIATMSGIQSRLDGLSAKVDALAERKDGKDGKGKDLTVRIVKVSHAHKVSGRGLIWVVEHDDSIHPGTLVCSSNGSLGGRVMEVTGIDATSRPGQPVGLLVKPVKA